MDTGKILSIYVDKCSVDLICIRYIYNLVSGTANMYMWDETTSRRGSQEIGSCLLKFVKSLEHQVNQVIAYSDCCPGQNLNVNIVKYWMHIVSNTPLETIHHKFLEPGHTFNECDQDFGVIEKRKRNETHVYIPDHWLEVVTRASKKFVVTKMNQTDFRSIANMNLVTQSVVRNDTEGNVIKWREIRWIHIKKECPFVMHFKTTLNEDIEFYRADFSKPLRGRPPHIELDQLYNEPIPIKIAKWKNLQELKSFIPPIHHSFFDDLRHEDEPIRTQGRRRVRGRGRSTIAGRRPADELAIRNSDVTAEGDVCSSDEASDIMDSD